MPSSSEPGVSGDVIVIFHSVAILSFIKSENFAKFFTCVMDCCPAHPTIVK